MPQLWEKAPWRPSEQWDISGQCEESDSGLAHAGKPIDVSAETRRLADWVNYEEGAVVSRTILEKKGGTVTLFALDEGQGLSEHTAPFDAIVLLVDGEAEVTISNKSHRLRIGDHHLAVGTALPESEFRARTRAFEHLP